MSDPIRDLLATPDDDEIGEQSFYEMSLMVTDHRGLGPTWELAIPGPEKERIEEDIRTQGTPFFQRLEFVSCRGARQIWFDVKVVSLVSNTPETRRLGMLKEVDDEARHDKLRKEHRKTLGMEFDE